MPFKLGRDTHGLLSWVGPRMAFKLGRATHAQGHGAGKGAVMLVSATVGHTLWTGRNMWAGISDSTMPGAAPNMPIPVSLCLPCGWVGWPA